MEAIRIIKKVMNHQVLVDVPELNEDQEVEVIIVPHASKGDSSLPQLLLKGPIWSLEEVKDIASPHQQSPILSCTPEQKKEISNF